MQAKQTNPATKDQKLTSIEEQLLECARNHTPVLLYGKDNIGYHDLVLRTYNEVLIEQGIDRIVNFELEYFDSKENPLSIQELKEVYGARHKDAVLKRIIGQFTNCYSESTVKTRKIIDCTGMNGKELYAELIELPTIEDKEFGTYKKKEELKTIDDYDYERQQNKGYLFQCKGLLILNNLQINYGNSEDITYYNKLGKIIRDKEKGIEQITINWIVAYTQKTDDFPPGFLKQFKEISLEPEKQATLTNTLAERDKTTGITPFPTPPGTQWHEVKISFIDNEYVKISARDKTETRHYFQMGLKGRGGIKSSLFWVFFKELASLSGQFTNCPDTKKVKVKKYFSELRKVLKQLFKIDGNPIPYKKTKDYTGYKTDFILENKLYSEYENSTREHLKEYVPPKHKHILQRRR